MLISLVVIWGTVLLVISTVGQLIALIRQQQALATQGSIGDFIGATLATNEFEAHVMDHKLSKLSRPDRVADFVQDIMNHTNNMDVESGKGSITTALLNTAGSTDVPTGYTLKRE